jgi:arylsulfatase A-like enzyme
MSKSDDSPSDPKRRDFIGAGAALLGVQLLPEMESAAETGGQQVSAARSSTAPESPPPGYNILFILVDQEHFFERWPFPAPGREWLKRNGITFLNHQAASCACSPARSILYTGLHIQRTGIFDNVNSPWQANMSTAVKTVGHRLAQLGYHPAYQGKWHLSHDLDRATDAVDAPMATYRKIIEGYGFQDFLGFGDITDTTLGGYNYDEATTAFAARWLRSKGTALNAKGTSWYLAVNFVNPHDVMYVNSDLPGETVQGRDTVEPIARPPANELYKASWDEPLPLTRRQPFDAAGRPFAHQVYQTVQDLLVGQWPDEDRRWRVLRDYYFNCIRDCDRQVVSTLNALRETGMAEKTIIVFTADHGELGGAHQMRGKGNCTYREQNHLPLMIVHPAYPGGIECRAMTSEIDLVPTLLALTGKTQEQRKLAGDGLPGRDFSPLLRAPERAGLDAMRPATLFSFNMLLYQDANWIARLEQMLRTPGLTGPQKAAWIQQYEPNFHQRCGLRSVFDGRYRFSRYFAPLQFNTPETYEDLVAMNDLELYDLEADPHETRNLASEAGAGRDLVMTMNEKLNARLAEEVGQDDGAFLPLRGGRWVLPKPDER